MATITPTKSDDNKRIHYQGVTNADTPAEIQIADGKHTIEVKGTFDSASVELHWGSASGDLGSIDSDASPDGLTFTTRGATTLEVSGGFVKPVISGGGGSQDIDIIIVRH